MFPRPTVEFFDAWLSARALSFEAIVVGGSALALLGVTSRQTRDFDILHPKLPEAVSVAAREFAGHLRGEGTELADDWLNNGPMDLVDSLPSGWKKRLRTVFSGKALSLTTLGRFDLLKTKLFALCDRGTDLPDCVSLAPSASELNEAEAWVIKQDAHSGWPRHVRATLKDLGERLNHGV